VNSLRSWLGAPCLLLAGFVLAFAVPLEVYAHVVPQPKRFQLSGDPISLRGATIAIEPRLRKAVRASVASLQVTFGEALSGPRISIRQYLAQVHNELPQDVRTALARPQSYWVRVSPTEIEIVGADIQGVVHGVTLLEQLVRSNGSVPVGEVLDWPTHGIRALHIVARGTSVESLRRIIVQARYARLNTLVLALADGIELKSLPGIARADAISRTDLLSFVRFANENGIVVIPELKLLSHQEKFLKKQHPTWLYNRLTYNPNNDKLYRGVIAVIDEVIELFQPFAIHIGHDEVAGIATHLKLEGDERSLPPDLFEKDVKVLHGHLKSRNIETWMWGDMLLLPSEFPSMHKVNMNGFGGYAQLRDRLPRDIVICDWHYFDTQGDFPSSKRFTELGYRVLGATWKRPETIDNFSRYVADLPNGGAGMIATTWFHVQRGEWEIVERIIRTSGEAFWNAR